MKRATSIEALLGSLRVVGIVALSSACLSGADAKWDRSHGPLDKMGFAGGEKWMTGHMYFFNNTSFQAADDGADGLGGSSRVIKHCVTRNNIFHVRKSDTHSISTGGGVDNDFDFDLLSGRHPDGQERHGVSGVPRYAPGAGFDLETRRGTFQLAAGSPGHDAGSVIPNFCDAFAGKAPDMGAHESGAAPMEFGVRARFVPQPERR